MRSLLIIIAVVLFIAWIFGFIIFHVAGFLIHVLLILAVIAVIIRLIKGS